jgi:hypothetical protein
VTRGLGLLLDVAPGTLTPSRGRDGLAPCLTETVAGGQPGSSLRSSSRSRPHAGRRSTSIGSIPALSRPSSSGARSRRGTRARSARPSSTAGI